MSATRWGLLLGAATAAGSALAQDRPAPPRLITGSWTNFAASELAGSGDSAVQAGGKFDLFGNLDLQDLGFWPGLSLGGHAEFVYGRNVTNADPFFLVTPNTALFFPVNSDQGADLSLAFTQRFGAASLTIGKINMIDTVALTPLVGGGGLEGFQHLQFAAPLTNMTPPSVFGALISAPIGRGVWTIGLWDSESAVQEIWPENDFAEVNGVIGLTLPVTVRGLPGWQSLQAQGTTEGEADLADLPYLALAPALRPDLEEKSAGWMLKYSFQQYLWRSRDDPARGWGVFGQINAWDGNPTLTDWGFSVGMTGVGPLASRPLDRFGLGYFVLSPSNELIASLKEFGLPVLPRDERGAEAFYTWQVGGRWRLTTTGQVIEPGIEATDTAWIFGLRALASF